jgi:hypothetical protein
MYAKRQKGNFPPHKATYLLMEVCRLVIVATDGRGFAQNGASEKIDKFCKKVLRISGRYIILKMF